MSRLIEFALDSKGQTVVLVETNDPTPAQGQTRVSVGGAVAEKASQAFDAAIAGIKPIADTVMAQLTEAVADATEISVQCWRNPGRHLSRRQLYCLHQMGS